MQYRLSVKFSSSLAFSGFLTHYRL